MSHDLKHEVARLWNLRKMLVIVVSALGSVTKNVGTWIDQLGFKVSTVFVLQKATLTGTARTRAPDMSASKIVHLIIFHDPLLCSSIGIIST